MSAITAKFLYRYQSSIVQNFFPDSEELEIYELKLPVIKYNPCSVWVDYFGVKKIVYFGAAKKFAYETKEEAMNSFRMRKYRHVQILRYRLEEAEETLRLFNQNKYTIVEDKG